MPQQPSSTSYDERVAYYDRAHTHAKNTLARIVAEFRTAEVKAPETQFIADGLIVYNCELLCVGVNRFFSTGLSDGPAGEIVRTEQGWSWRSAELEVVHLRCSPQINEHIYDGSWNPKPDDVTASAKIVHRDAEIITKALIAGNREELFGAGRNNMALAGWDAIGEQAGLVGGRLRFRVGL